MWSCDVADEHLAKVLVVDVACFRHSLKHFWIPEMMIGELDGSWTLIYQQCEKSNCCEGVVNDIEHQNIGSMIVSGQYSASDGGRAANPSSPTCIREGDWKHLRSN